MAPRVATLLLPIALLACSRGPERFTNRKDLAPLRERLRATGGDPTRVIRVRALQDLAALQVGERYRFAIPEDGQLRVAPLPASAANNEYVHPLLVDGAPVRTAGYIVVKHLDRMVTGAMIDRDSRAYCPSAQSVQVAIDALRALGLDRSRISVDPVPPQCESH
ncbi:MAG: hypothetical protein U0325_09495 [Polyangiales bacterium]